jgi:hypothetical protein
MLCQLSQQLGWASMLQLGCVMQHITLSEIDMRLAENFLYYSAP